MATKNCSLGNHVGCLLRGTGPLSSLRKDRALLTASISTPEFGFSDDAGHADCRAIAGQVGCREIMLLYPLAQRLTRWSEPLCYSAAIPTGAHEDDLDNREFTILDHNSL